MESKFSGEPERPWTLQELHEHLQNSPFQSRLAQGKKRFDVKSPFPQITQPIPPNEYGDLGNVSFLEEAGQLPSPLQQKQGESLARRLAKRFLLILLSVPSAFSGFGLSTPVDIPPAPPTGTYLPLNPDNYVLTTWQEILKSTNDVHKALEQLDKAIEGALSATANPRDRGKLLLETRDVWKAQVKFLIKQQDAEEERLEKNFEALAQQIEEKLRLAPKELKTGLAHAHGQPDFGDEKEDEEFNLAEVVSTAGGALNLLLKYSLDHE